MVTSPPSSRDQVRVLIADDQPLLRHSLRIVIDDEADLAVVGEAGTGVEAVAAARELCPDVVLMDIRMPDGDGIDATDQITGDPVLSGTRVVVLTMFELDEYVYGALRAGASGFLLKDARPHQLIEAVRGVHRGESLFAPTVLSRLISHYVNGPGPAPPTVIAPLTARENEVLTRIGRGLSNDEVARALVLSVNTVKTHVGNLLAKLHARDRAQLVIAAYEQGLVSAGAQQHNRSGHRGQGYSP